MSTVDIIGLSAIIGTGLGAIVYAVWLVRWTRPRGDDK